MKKKLLFLFVLLIGISLSVGAENVKKINIEYNDETATLSIDRSKVKKFTFTEKAESSCLTFTVNNVIFKMIKVEAGEFQMGANDISLASPAHKVTLTKDYYMGETEVTQALYKAVTNNTPSEYSGDQLPVESVSYNDITDENGFLATLNAKIAELYKDKTYTFRLPTEAEWEFAARGGNKSQGYTYSGSNTIDDVAWYDYISDNSTHPVATKKANELGLYDMSGNVWEWCSDWYGTYSSEEQTDPTGPTEGVIHIIHGGSWGNYQGDCRPSYRYAYRPSTSSSLIGFRLALAGNDVKNNINIEYNDGTETLSIDRSKVKKITFTEETPAEQTFTVGSVSFKVIKVEKGDFQMGSTDVHASDDEQPVHKVTLTKDYYMGETQVTQGLWMAVMGSDNNPSSNQGDKLPVENVSYNDITGENGFLATLKEKTGKTFRLPTEAEWEFAARGGNQSKSYTYSGSNTIGDVAWYSGNCSSTKEVAGKNPNELGLYDMSGNVYEWCSDWYGTYSSDAQTDPTGPTNGTDRVIRGGSWGLDEWYSRSSCRDYSSSYECFDDLGFRLCLSAE